jgi:cytochrome d ubiquinol oxidase subunit I
MGSISSVRLKSICLSDLTASESRLPLINAVYYLKIAFGIADLISLLGLVALNFNLGPLSKITRIMLSRMSEQRRVFLLSFVVLVASVFASGLGWFVREVGRKPWTVYGLLYPEELVTRVPVEPIIILFAMLFVAIAIIGIYGMYVVSTRRVKFIELLKKGAGVE